MLPHRHHSPRRGLASEEQEVAAVVAAWLRMGQVASVQNIGTRPGEIDAFADPSTSFWHGMGSLSGPFAFAAMPSLAPVLAPVLASVPAEPAEPAEPAAELVSVPVAARATVWMLDPAAELPVAASLGIELERELVVAV